MYTNNLAQLKIFLYFIFTGICLAIIFDIFRILRKSFKTPDIITNIEDILFGLVSATILLISIFLFNNGELRLFIFVAILIGIIFYLLFISKYFIKFSVTIISFIKKFIILLTKPFIILFKFIKTLFFNPISFIFINLKLLTNKIFIKFEKNTKTHKKENKKEGF